MSSLAGETRANQRRGGAALHLAAAYERVGEQGVQLEVVADAGEPEQIAGAARPVERDAAGGGWRVAGQLRDMAVYAVLNSARPVRGRAAATD